MMMAQFPEEQSEDGSFTRQPDEFRNWVETPEAGRYHLYVCKACPWAHRAWLTLKLMGLDEVISVNFVDPIRDDETGWAFREGKGHGLDDVEGFGHLSEAYYKTKPNFKGRITVPVLWDKQEKKIINNSEDDIIEMWAGIFKPLAKHPVTLFPEDIQNEQAALSLEIYKNVNNGVYETGFASSQSAYEKGYDKLFTALDKLEARLADGGPYLRLFSVLAFMGQVSCSKLSAIRPVCAAVRYVDTLLCAPFAKHGSHPV